MSADAPAHAANPDPESQASSGFASGLNSIPLPRLFGRLVLLKLLARGGMGDVYLATTTGIEGAERPIVVKTVRRDHIHDGSFLARFLDEARVQSQLNHPGVAQVLEASTDENGEPYTVVEHVEGRSLADVRHRAVQMGARISWPDAVAVAIEMGQALAHVHERAGADGSPLGIVHRDLSPQNVMIGYAGEVKLIDFGTARGHNRRCHTVAGVVFAKPGYVAPEVARQQVGDGRIDVYAMGVMLWELCAGKRLLSGDAQQHLEDVAAGRFQIPALFATRGIPRELDEVIQKLCANDPDDRYASAAVASTDLARILAQAPTSRGGERSVRARVAALMKTLWPHEPARSRAEFAKLLRQTRELRRGESENTPPASGVMEAQAAAMGDSSVLSGTPYRLLKKIGEGASGEVFEAEHIELGHRYAVKVLSAPHTAAHDAIERFRREARAIAKLRHPNLVKLHDFGKSLDGRVFLAMELLEGKTLDVHAEDEIGWREAVRLGIQATRALEAAHDAGLVHRDLKPQNLFLTNDGDLKLLDFGVAMALAETEGAEKRQRGFAVFGTPEYMAPEQVSGEAVDARCDIYALGCVLYELVTGSRPFEGSPVVVMGKQLRDYPERPRTRSPHAGMPAELDIVIMRALSKSKEERFESARALRDALEESLAAPVRRMRRGRRIATAVLVGSVAVLAMAGLKGREVLPSILSMKSAIATVVRSSEPQKPAVQPTVVPVESAPVESAAEPAQVAAAANEGASSEPAATNTIASVTESNVASARVEDSKPTLAKASAPRLPETKTATDRTAVQDKASVNADKPGGGLIVRAGMRTSDTRTLLVEARAQAHQHPSDPKALKAWAMAAARAGEHREARRAAESWAVHDASVEPRLFLAGALDAAGRRREGRAVLEEWLSNHPDTPEARKMLGRLGATPEPAIKRSARSRTSRAELAPIDPLSSEE